MIVKFSTPSGERYVSDVVKVTVTRCFVFKQVEEFDDAKPQTWYFVPIDVYYDILDEEDKDEAVIDWSKYINRFLLFTPSNLEVLVKDISFLGEEDNNPIKLVYVDGTKTSSYYVSYASVYLLNESGDTIDRL